MSSWVEAFINAAGAAILAGAAAAQLWHAWRLASSDAPLTGGGAATPRARRVTLRDAHGNTIVVMASPDTLQALLGQRVGWPAGVAGPAGGEGGGGDLDSYEGRLALDAGVRPPGPPVTPALLDCLPTHAHTPPRASADGTPAPPRADGLDTCSVCLGDFFAGETVRTLPCLHRYHPSCVDPWLVQKGRAQAACPTCKTRVFSQ